jgi:hypothetical protein
LDYKIIFIEGERMKKDFQKEVRYRPCDRCETCANVTADAPEFDEKTWAYFCGLGKMWVFRYGLCDRWEHFDPMEAGRG